MNYIRGRNISAKIISPFVFLYIHIHTNTHTFLHIDISCVHICFSLTLFFFLCMCMSSAAACVHVVECSSEGETCFFVRKTTINKEILTSSCLSYTESKGVMKRLDQCEGRGCSWWSLLKFKIIFRWLAERAWLMQ